MTTRTAFAFYFQRITMLLWLPMVIPFTIITALVRFMALVSDDFWQTFFNFDRTALRRAFGNDSRI